MPSYNRDMVLFRLVLPAMMLGQGELAADKSILELQRDMALLQDQMRSLDERMGAMQTLLQQIAQETSGISAKSDARMDKLQAAMEQAIKSEVGQVAAPIAGVTAKLESMGGEVASLRDASGEVTRQVTTLRSQMDE